MMKKVKGIKSNASDIVLNEPGPSSSGDEELSSVIYIGHLPHGFYEKELLGYFSQFGRLKHVRLSRSKKTGKAKHYAFLEFQHVAVAKIAAEAMDGYFLFTQVHPELFKGANRKFKNIPWKKLDAERHNRARTPEEHAKRVARAIKRDAKRKERIAAAGIDYEYDGLDTLVQAPPKRIKFSD